MKGEKAGRKVITVRDSYLGLGISIKAAFTLERFRLIHFQIDRVSHRFRGVYTNPLFKNAIIKKGRVLNNRMTIKWLMTTPLKPTENEDHVVFCWTYVIAFNNGIVFAVYTRILCERFWMFPPMFPDSKLSFLVSASAFRGLKFSYIQKHFCVNAALELGLTV